MPKTSTESQVGISHSFFSDENIFRHKYDLILSQILVLCLFLGTKNISSLYLYWNCFTETSIISVFLYNLTSRLQFLLCIKNINHTMYFTVVGLCP